VLIPKPDFSSFHRRRASLCILGSPATSVVEFEWNDVPKNRIQDPPCFLAIVFASEPCGITANGISPILRQRGIPLIQGVRPPQAQPDRRSFPSPGFFTNPPKAIASPLVGLNSREFFEKSRELFPDTALEIVSLFEDGDHAIAQWKLSATQTVPYSSTSYRFPIFLFGATIVRVEKGKIVQWSDYHDHSSSRRMSLPAFFTEGI
jgi:hypothetical protein